MKMNKKQYRIGDLAQELKIKKFVLRFWEKELDLKPQRSIGGQRFYQEEDFETFKLIKSLLYERQFTLAGAKKELESVKSHRKSVIPSQKTQIIEDQQNRSLAGQYPTIHHELCALQSQLKKLQKIL